MKTTVKEQDNMGGVIRLCAIHYLDISFGGETATVLSEERIYALELTQQQAGAISEQKTNFKGTTYLHEISGFVPGCDDETAAIINAMSRMKKFVVVYQDSQGNYVMLGRPEIPIRFTGGFETGEYNNSLRGYRVKFSGYVHFPPVRLKENIFD
jgi:hypothetical protein